MEEVYRRSAMTEAIAARYTLVLNQEQAAAVLDTTPSSMSRWTASGNDFTRGGKAFTPTRLLEIAEQHDVALHAAGARLIRLARAEGPEAWAVVRAEVNAYLAEYRRRRDPAQVLTRAEFVEELRLVLDPRGYDELRSRLAYPADALDLYGEATDRAD
jgi:hypothetical protein